MVHRGREEPSVSWRQKIMGFIAGWAWCLP